MSDDINIRQQLGLLGFVIVAWIFGVLRLALEEGGESFFNIWRESFAADVLFVVATVLVGFGAYQLAKHDSLWWTSFACAFLGMWLIYFLAWSIIFGEWSDFDWIFKWTWPGLVVTAVAPWLWHKTTTARN